MFISNTSIIAFRFENGSVKPEIYATFPFEQPEQAQSVLSQRQEAVNKARTNLGYATITSPIDGIVLSKAVEEG